MENLRRRPYCGYRSPGSPRARGPRRAATPEREGNRWGGVRHAGPAFRHCMGKTLSMARSAVTAAPFRYHEVRGNLSK